MQEGVTFPQSEIGADPEVIRDYAQAAEDLGYEHLLAYDHVLGADPSNREGWRGYTHKTMFHEPLTLFCFLAAITQRLELVSGVIVLPQRQSALVAKQAAEVDVLSNGRLRLGVGIGWNAVEYEALGEDFSTRGARIEEQIEVMRLLWSREVVSFEGRFHRIDEAGINPLQPFVATCGSGVTANSLIFAAHLLGNDRTRLYDGSWSEWGADPATPKAKGAA